METTTLTAANGIAFTARIVREGDTYGRNNVLTHDEADPLVEFYDTRYPHTALGQFVSRYYFSTLIEAPTGRGLDLDGGVPDWTLDADTFRTFRAWILETA